MSSLETTLPENDLTLKFRNAESAFENSIFSFFSVVYPTKIPFRTSLSDPGLRKCVKNMAEYQPPFRMDGFEKPFEIKNKEKLGSQAKTLVKIVVQENGSVDSDVLTEIVVRNWDKVRKMNKQLWELELAEAEYYDSVKRYAEDGLKNAK